MDNTLHSVVLGGWSWGQVWIGVVIALLVGSVGCFRIDAYYKGYEEGFKAGSAVQQIEEA